MTDHPRQQRVFVSHSTEDKQFVGRLVTDLKALKLDVFFDEHSIKIGDSIPTEVFEAIEQSDYMIVVLTPAFLKSGWSKLETDAAIMAKAQGKLKVLPIMAEPCEPPPTLKAILYANFTEGYKKGLETLARVFQISLSHNVTAKPSMAPDCHARMASLETGDLIDLLCEKLDRINVQFLWDRVLLPSKLENELPGVPHFNCCLGLVERCEKTKKLDTLRQQLCKRFGALVNPR